MYEVGACENDGDHETVSNAGACAPNTPQSGIAPAFREALLRELAAAPEGLSLPRLIKRLGVRMSVLMRALAWLGDTRIGAQRGEGLVVVEQRGETRIARLATATPLDDERS